MESNPACPFAPYTVELDESCQDEAAADEKTQILRDDSRSILSRNSSPDLPFQYSVNPYRGCEHGCVYCYARCYHEYLGYSAGLDFETRIVVKESAPDLLRKALSQPSWIPQEIVFSGGTDCYQPLEKTFRLTRRCLEVLAEFRNPVSIITKNHLITRDLDILQELAGHQAIFVWISLISLDGDLIRRLEPRTSQPSMRLEIIRSLSRAGVPVGIMVAPVIPGLTEHEIPSLIESAAAAGAGYASVSPLRLPGSVRDIFQSWVEGQLPDQAPKILGGLRGNPASHSMKELIPQLFRLAVRKAGLSLEPPELSTAHFRDPAGQQLRLFT